jgi:hypothetical protein
MIDETNLIDAVKKYAELPTDQKEAYKIVARATLAKDLEVCEEGFSNWYWCGTRHELPPYAREKWVPKLVEAWKNKTGVLLEGFRGATKSTIIFWWVLYILGKRPVGNTVLVRINDAAASETGNAMAEIIEKTVAWKLCFPNIVPDKERKWSAEGWFVKDTSIAYPLWIQQTTADHLGEPSLLTAGITSGIHIGKHPSNGWYFDDFHDEQNTRSRKEMENIVSTLEKNIIPTWSRPGGHPTLAGACTLWDEKDGYHSILKTGLFEHVRTPIFTIDPTSDLIYPGLSHNGEHIRLAWPEEYPLEKILAIEKQNPVWFPVMYLCDLTALKGNVLKGDWLHTYPAEQIGADWPVYFGVDFASSDDQLKEGKHDYFALAIGKAIPGGGVVLVDGIRGKWPAAESMARLVSFRAKYPALDLVGVEKWGSGKTFKDMLIYNTDLPVIQCPYEGSPTKSKGQRYQAEGGLAPMFVDGRMWVTSQPPPDQGGEFIQAFKDEWVGWDGNASITGHDDSLDAVYWMAYVAQGHLVPTAQRTFKPRQSRGTDPYSVLTQTY